MNSTTAIRQFVLVIIILGTMTCSRSSLNSRYSRHVSHALTEYLDQFLENTPVYCGIAVQRLRDKTLLYGLNHTHAFTPASNLKLLTIHQAMHLLADSLVWMIYDKASDFYYPMGDPSFLHPDFLALSPVSDFFVEHHAVNDTIHINIGHDYILRFAPGWAWDDYLYRFQTERSIMPIHAGLAYLTITQDSCQIKPSWMPISANVSDSNKLQRLEFANHVRYPDSITLEDYPIPYTDNLDMISSYIASLGMTCVFHHETSLPLDGQWIHSVPTDTIYQYCIQNSDNAIAEQLRIQMDLLVGDSALQASNAWFMDEPNYRVNIVDGSGLSRYNQASPLFFAHLLSQMVVDHGLHRVLNILAEAGTEGTLTSLKTPMRGSIFGKSGSLKHCYNFSGLVRTNEEEWLAVSILINHMEESSRPEIKRHISQMLDIIISDF